MPGSLRRVNLMDEKGKFVRPVLESFSEPQQAGNLNLLEGMLRNPGSPLLSFWPILLSSTPGILAHTWKRTEGEKNDIEAPEPEEDVGGESRCSRTLRGY